MTDFLTVLANGVDVCSVLEVLIHDARKLDPLDDLLINQIWVAVNGPCAESVELVFVSSFSYSAFTYPVAALNS